MRSLFFSSRKIQHFFQSVCNAHVFAGAVFGIFMGSSIKVILSLPSGMGYDQSPIFLGSALGHTLSIQAWTSNNIYQLLADAKPHAESHSSDVTRVPWSCQDNTAVSSILNQSPRACISPRTCSIARTSVRNPSRRCGDS